MKKFLLPILFTMLAFGAKAQSITIYNQTSCPEGFVLYAYDANGGQTKTNQYQIGPFSQVTFPNVGFIATWNATTPIDWQGIAVYPGVTVPGNGYVGQGMWGWPSTNTNGGCGSNQLSWVQNGTNYDVFIQ